MAAIVSIIVCLLRSCRNMHERIKLRLRMKRKRMTQAERREETREQVLAAAARVFAARGFHATSLDAIAEEAGFSRGAVYYNFADKEELFLELLDRRCAERAQDLREVFADTDDRRRRSHQPAGPGRRRPRARRDDRRHRMARALPGVPRPRRPRRGVPASLCQALRRYARRARRGRRAAHRPRRGRARHGARATGRS